MKTRFLTIAGLAAMLAACSNDDEAPSSKPDALTDTPVTVNVSVDAPASRGGYDADNLPTGFVLFLKQNADKDYSIDPAVNCNYNYGNVYMASENNVWGAKNMGTTPMLWKNSTPAAEVTAYTLQGDETPEFSAEAPSESFRVEVLADQTTDENVKKSDWLYYRGTNINPSDGAISIPFEHKLSKLKLLLTKGTELKDEDISFESVTIDGCCRLTTTANLTGTSTSLLTETDEPQTESISMMRSDAADDLSWECILVPQSLSFLTVKIEASNGKSYRYKSEAGIEFESGKINTLRLTVGYDKALVEGITAESWGTAITAGEVETE